MKILVLVMMLSIALMAATATFPGWDKPVSVYQELVSAYESAAADAKPCTKTTYNMCRFALAIQGNDVSTFEALMVIHAATFPDGANGSNYAYSKVAADYWKDRTSPNALRMLREAHAYSLAHGDYHAGVFAARPAMAKGLGLSVSDRVTALTQGLATVPAGIVSEVSNMLDALYKVLPDSSVPVQDQLDILKKANRRFSKELLGKNKDKWEPIIVKLRTVIASY